jgi:hypothetical protein
MWHAARVRLTCRSLPSPQVGLDAAGKTTILYKLKLGEIVTTIPTIGASRPPPWRPVCLPCLPATPRAGGMRGVEWAMHRWWMHVHPMRP